MYYAKVVVSYFIFIFSFLIAFIFLILIYRTQNIICIICSNTTLFQNLQIWTVGWFKSVTVLSNWKIDGRHIIFWLITYSEFKLSTKKPCYSNVMNCIISIFKVKMMVKTQTIDFFFRSYELFQRYQLTYPSKGLPRVSQLISLEWQVGSENKIKDMGFTIIFISRTLHFCCCATVPTLD